MGSRKAPHKFFMTNQTDQLDQITPDVLSSLMQQAEAEPIRIVSSTGAAFVLQSASSYQKLLDDIEQAETVAGIQRGLDSMKQGKGRPASEVMGEIRQMLSLT